MSDEPAPEIKAHPHLKPGKMKFTMCEKLLILSLDDDLGTVEPSVKGVLRYILSAAILAELALAGKIRCGEANQPTDGRLIVVNSLPTGNDILDAALSTLGAEEKPRKLARWIEALGQKQTVRQVATRLEERGVLRIEEKRLLWLNPYNIYPQRDATAKYLIKRRLRALTLAGGKVTPADIALLSLLKSSRLLKLIFTRDERRAASKIIDALGQKEMISVEVTQLLADIETAAAAVSAIAVAAG